MDKYEPCLRLTKKVGTLCGSRRSRNLLTGDCNNDFTHNCTGENLPALKKQECEVGYYVKNPERPVGFCVPTTRRGSLH
jgi:hypothetical protein